MYPVETHEHQVAHQNGRSHHRKYRVKDAGWRVGYGKLAGNARQTRVRLCCVQTRVQALSTDCEGRAVQETSLPQVSLTESDCSKSDS